MTRKDIERTIAGQRGELRKMGVATLALFGSMARDEPNDDSDVDFLVEFDRPVGLFTFYRLQERLEEILECDSVHLVLRRAVLDDLKDSIYEEAIPCLEETGTSASVI